MTTSNLAESESSDPRAGVTTRSLACEYLVKHAAQVLAAQRQDGAFFPYPEWKDPSMFHQYCLYPLAWLYQDPQAGTWYHNPELLRAVRQAAAYTIGQLHPDGSLPVYSRGDYFGRVPDEWWTYFCLQTWLLIRDELAADESARWESALRCSLAACAARVAKELDDPAFAYGRGAVQNHYVWFALVVYLGGQTLGEKAWLELGRRALDRLVAEQDVDGGWPENSGPTTNYSRVASTAISLYAIHSDNPAAGRAVERALEFERVFTYSDGPLIETIDGRVRYHPTRGLLPPGYDRWPHGRAYLQRQIINLLSEPFGEGFFDIAFFTDVARYTTAAPMVNEELPAVSVLPSGRGAVVRAQDWLCVVSACLAPPSTGRYHLDRQSHLSLWHRATGLITGGGGSKNQPAFSTLVLENSDGSVRQYMADRAVITQADQSGVVMELQYEDQRVTLRAELVNDRQTIIETRWDSAGQNGLRLFLQLPLRILAGQKLQVDGQVYELGPNLLETQVHREIEFGNWRVLCPGASLRWPVSPFNSYKLNGQSGLTAAYGIMRLPLPVGGHGSGHRECGSKKRFRETSAMKVTTTISVMFDLKG